MKAYLITIIILACVVGFFAIIKLYLKLSMGWDKSPTCLLGKTAIVTGANTGIGFYTAQDFAKRGARVILACRNPGRGEEARKRIVEATGNQNIIVKVLDLTSLASVRKFAIEFKATEDRLDILVNNAGVWPDQHSKTSDGLSLILETNHLGPFLLTILLIGLLKASAPSRVVNVSSVAAHFVGTLNLDELNDFPTAIIKPWNKTKEYAITKLCNVLFTNELARKLKGTGITVNSLHPGVINTELFRYAAGIWERIIVAVGKAFSKTAEQGAQTTIYLAVSKDISGVSGEHFADCRKFWMPRAGKDEELAQRLWEKSEKMVKLTPEERSYI